MTRTHPKLTTPQVNALAELLDRPHRWSDGWQPARALVEKGLATKQEGRLGQPKFTITEAGRSHPAVAVASPETSHADQ